MKYTVKKELNISAMTLGTVQLGLSYGVNNTSGKPTEEQSFAILDTAFKGGVTILDTSNDYGDSETVIGNYMRANADKKFLICTKFRIDEEAAKDVYGSLRAFALDSCKKLGVDCLDIFMSHIEDDYLNYGDELAKALAALKAEGIIKLAGMSMSKKDKIDAIIDSGIFDAVQVPMNIWDNKVIRDGTIKRMSDAGIAVFVRSVYLQGLFFKSVDDVKNTKFRDAAPLIEKLNEIAKEEGLTVPELALAFIRDTEGVASLVVGSETAAQVEQNVDVFNVPTLSEATYNKILTEFSNVDTFLISPWEWPHRKD